MRDDSIRSFPRISTTVSVGTRTSVISLSRSVSRTRAFNLHQHITRIEHAGRFDSFVSPHFYDRFGGDQDFRYFALQIGIPDARLQAVANLLLVSRVS